jgi:hypothetical protein
MKVKNIFEYMKDYDPEEEIAISWYTKQDIEEHYNAGDPLPDGVWDVLLDTIGYDGDAIGYDVSYAIEYVKELKAKDENPI